MAFLMGKLFEEIFECTQPGGIDGEEISGLKDKHFGFSLDSTDCFCKLVDCSEEQGAIHYSGVDGDNKVKRQARNENNTWVLLSYEQHLLRLGGPACR